MALCAEFFLQLMSVNQVCNTTQSVNFVGEISSYLPFPEVPALYTSIPYHHDWILATRQRYLCFCWFFIGTYLKSNAFFCSIMIFPRTRVSVDLWHFQAYSSIGKKLTPLELFMKLWFVQHALTKKRIFRFQFL